MRKNNYFAAYGLGITKVKDITILVGGINLFLLC